MATQDRASGSAQLAQWLTGKWISHALYVAARLEIADALQNGGRSIDELAAATGTHAQSLYRLLRALCSIGVFRETEPRHFETSELGALLTLDEIKRACLMVHSDWHDRAWSELLYSVKTGRSGFEKAHGAPLFDWLAAHPQAQRDFDGAMSAGRAYRNHEIATRYDFSAYTSVVDVGGGEGALVILLLQHYAQLSGCVADLPATLERAGRAVAKAGLTERCAFVPTDFFAAVPPGADVYILSNILHDWDDRRCGTILSNCRKVMRPQGRLLVVEAPLPKPNEPDRANWLDLEMLVLTDGGRERTLEEYRALLASSGFALLRAIPMNGNRTILEAEPRAHAV